MYRQKHQQRMTLTALAVLVVPLAAACGSEKAGAGSGTARAEDPITGIRWTVDGVTVDGTAHRAPDGAHLTFDEDGGVEGDYGCNLFKGRVAFEGDRIRLTDRDTTLRACDQRVMDLESALADTLGDGALRTDVNDDRLTLTTGSGDTVRLSRAGDTPLYGTEWTVTTPAVDGRAHLTFDKEEGTVAGRLGCNHVNADATVRDGHITLGAPSLTRMMCEDSLMDAEKALTKLFNGTADYRIEGRTLTLTSENGTSVRAVAER
ncbi:MULTISPECIES: META domain-containing protein [unclassified Streptomyces]|uniref:META domain-containing protein n=1 Tax=unclassified Streptomyces TaxID=2593676 RepID=UPI000A1E71D2|nr:META domain-containing protein [Streptomyces sp. 13-12-16]OSP45001.1 META domain-containing protein [Streptomyces sp. 13-12-16]